MKKLFAAALLALSLSAPLIAGDVPFPTPPPCRDCNSASTTPVPAAIVALVLTLLASR
jgi:hypothetical protein